MHENGVHIWFRLDRPVLPDRAILIMMAVTMNVIEVLVHIRSV